MAFQRRLGLLLTGLTGGLLLLQNWVTPAQPTSLSALAHHPHLCQTTWDADGRHYPGFFCPRLSDTPEEAYCCHLQAAGGYCCTRAEFEALYQVNLSALPSPPILRGRGPLLALSLYTVLLEALMTADLVHFCCGRGAGRPPSASSAARPCRSLWERTRRAHCRSGPPTGAPPTGAPPTGAPPTGAPPTGAPPTGAPPTGAPPTGASRLCPAPSLPPPLTRAGAGQPTPDS